jgi:hypothetical protein
LRRCSQESVSKRGSKMFAKSRCEPRESKRPVRGGAGGLVHGGGDFCLSDRRRVRRPAGIIYFRDRTGGHPAVFDGRRRAADGASCAFESGAPSATRTAPALARRARIAASTATCAARAQAAAAEIGSTDGVSCADKSQLIPIRRVFQRVFHCPHAIGRRARDSMTYSSDDALSCELHAGSAAPR